MKLTSGFYKSPKIYGGSGLNITLTDGVQSENIICQVAGHITIGTTSHVEGIILSKAGITHKIGASLNG